MFAVSEGAVPYGSHVAISITNACPLECGHCISRSGPSTDRPDSKFPAAIHEFISRSEFPIEFVSITGGEPFYALPLLRDAIASLAAEKIAVGVVTSSFWAKTPETALRTLRELPGLTALCLSCDVFHTQYVKTSFVKNAYTAAKNLGIKVKIRSAVHLTQTSEETLLRQAIEAFADKDDLEYRNLVPYGRAENDASIERHDDRGEFCPSTGPHLDFNGHVTPCCNSITALPEPHTLTLGNVMNDGGFSVKSRILDDMLMMTLKLWGRPFFREVMGSQIETGISICDICYQLCSDEKLWLQVRSVIESPEHKIKTYALAFYQFGLKEARPRLVAALDELAAKRATTIALLP